MIGKMIIQKEVEIEMDNKFVVNYKYIYFRFDYILLIIREQTI